MLAKFVELPSFTRASRDLLGDTELPELQAFMMENPQAGEVISASSECCKIRW